MPKVHFIREDKQLDVPEGANLRKFCKSNGIQIYPWHARIANCLGNGLCGTCLVRIDDASALSARTGQEEIKLGAKFPGEYRLACQSKVKGDVRVLTQPNPPLGWHTHPGYMHMADPNPFEGMPLLGQEVQAEAQAEGLAALDAPAADAAEPAAEPATDEAAAPAE